jgi:hypothetical protein
LEDGVVSEQGTHRELLERGGRYAEMWEAQQHGIGQEESVGATTNERADAAGVGDTLAA